ncbi:MAG: hypothetical protein ACLT2V_17525 [Escherichia coli]
MKRHAIYFALALAGGVYPPGGAITRDAGPSLPVSHFITQVNAIRVSSACLPLDARRVSSDWRHAGLLCLTT